MLRSSLTTAGVLLLGASAFAQQSAPNRVKPITGPIRDAGVYHLATHTWTRHVAQNNLGADVIYNNTCTTPNYSPLTADHYIDEGRLPSPSSPQNVTSRHGCASSYSVDGFQLGYCTDQTQATFGTYTVNFYQQNAICGSVIGVTPTAGFGINGLPASPIAGNLACWVVTLDLDSPPQTASLAFTMLADGQGSFVTGGTNTFGWEMFQSGPTTAATGPFLAGDPNTCLFYAGTRWEPVVNYAEPGTGMGSDTHFRIESGPTPPGCYFFGPPPNPYGSFHLRLFANACNVAPPPTGTTFCLGDGSGTACPCGNASSAASKSGCLSSVSPLGTDPTSGATLRGSGNPLLGADTVVLTAAALPVNSVLFFEGTSQQNLGAGSLFGDGLRCAGGSVLRLGIKVSSGSPGQASSTYPQAGDLGVRVKGGVPAGGGTFTYQAWYRNPASFCTASTFNLSNGFQIIWT